LIIITVVDFVLYTIDIDIDIFVNCNWVATRWQLYNTHLHTNNTQNDTKQTIHRTTQNLSTTQNNTKLIAHVKNIKFTRTTGVAKDASKL
jgi:pantothenate kinase